MVIKGKFNAVSGVNSHLPSGYSANLTATARLAVAFYRAILILLSQPCQLFTNFPFQTSG
ncbi:hypothetical protein F0T03_08465 [Yersinia canariae]|uniref:Uncharacterized protein n=1 Tax=Yersinia canariae TaxID=2607663 RepID=A0A857EY96_9GAMM|nr:hypothetical protein F0T03_08465 [Yersinia canariae]